VRPVLLASLVAAVVLATGAPAAAQGEPAAFASTERGSLRVVSGAFVSPSSTDLRGVWLDETLGCDQWRGLRVSVLIDRVRAGRTTRIQRARSSAVRNCAEGGPNFGFTLRARGIGLACPDGTWQPGIYTFVVRTTHRASGLTSVLSLAWENTEAC
jgi:hypothetical protein